MRFGNNILKRQSEPTAGLSVLFFISLILGVYLGWISYREAGEVKDYVITLGAESKIKLLMQSFILHFLVFMLVIFRYSSEVFKLKLTVISSIIPLLTGVNIGKLVFMNGFIGLSMGIMSYLPHYILLILFYRKLTKKILSGNTFYKTDYVKYVMILLIISGVHVFVSRGLAYILL